MGAAIISILKVSPNWLLLLWEVLQNQQVVLTQALFELCLCAGTQGVKFCVYTLWAKSVSYISLGLLNLSPAGFQSQTFLGLISLALDS